MNDNGGRSLKIEVPGTPITKGSVKPYVGAHGHALPDDPRQTRWENTVRVHALDALNRAGLEEYDCPVRVECALYVPRPRNPRFALPAVQTAKTQGGGDLDKLLRAIGDALQTVNLPGRGLRRRGVIANDSRIVSWRADKRYADLDHPPGAVLTITPIQTEHD